MNEKEFVYERLNYLNDQVNFLTEKFANQQKFILDIINKMEKQQNNIEYLINIIELMQEPEYFTKQLKFSKMSDIKNKMDFIQKLKINKE